MKMNIIKYLFIIFVISLIGLAVYILYKDGDTKAFDMGSGKRPLEIFSDITIGITKYDTMNPVLSKSKDVQYISKLMFDSLMTVTNDYRIENALSEECVRLTPTIYLVKLKTDKTWHDGKELVAHDVKFTIDNLRSMESDSIYKENVQKISNVEIIDKYTLKIYLEEETPFFEYMLTFPILSIDNYEEGTLECKTDFPIGTGNYRITDIKDGKIELEKRNSDLDLKIEKIHINVYASQSILYRAITRGDIDLIVTSNINYEIHTGKLGINENISQDREFDYIIINTNNKTLSDPNVRKAINYAINKKDIVYNVHMNKYIPCKFPIDYGSYLYNTEQEEIGYNLIKTKEALTESGWEYKNRTWVKSNDNGILDFDLVVNEKNEKRVEVAENIRSQLATIGIKIRIRRVNDITFENYLINKDYDLILTGNISPIFPDLNTYLGPDNLSNYEKEEVLEIISEVGTIQNQEILEEKYKRLIEIYNEDMPFISLYFNSNIILYKSNLKGNLEHNWYNLFYNIGGWYRIN